MEVKENLKNSNKIFHENLIKIVAIPTLFFILAIAINHIQFRFLKNIQAQHQRLIEAKLALSDYFRLVIDAQTSVRGYYITKNLIFLEPYQNAVKNKKKYEERVFKMLQGDYNFSRDYRDLVDASDIWFESFAVPAINRVDSIEPTRPNYDFRAQAKKNFDIIRSEFKNINSLIDKDLKILKNKLKHTNHTIFYFELFLLAVFIGFLYVLLKKQVRSLVANYSKLIEENQRQFYKIEEASKSKDLFLANMSHEIRTPLGAILGFVDLALENNELNYETRGHLAFVKRNSSHLLDLVEDLFDLSKVASKKIEVFEENCNLIEILKDVKNIFSSKALDNKQKLNFQIVDRLPEVVITDPVRLRQILTNLIGNSIKFTRYNGSIDLRVSADENSFIFDIFDQGIGIPIEKQDIIFGKFQQGDSDHSRKYGGAGLGLSLSKNLAQLMDGDLILVDSQLDVGSHFRLTIPKKSASGKTFSNTEFKALSDSYDDFDEEASKVDKIGSLLKSIKILVVDDSKENQILYKIYLESVGAKVSVADTGLDAVRVAFGNNFDLIVMDIQMPGLDGYDALKILKDSNYDKKVIALTAHAMKGEKEKCLKAGFDGYLSKPVSKLVLVNYVANLVKKVPRPPEITL